MAGGRQLQHEGNPKRSRCVFPSIVSTIVEAKNAPAIFRSCTGHRLCQLAVLGKLLRWDNRPPSHSYLVCSHWDKSSSKLRSYSGTLCPLSSDTTSLHAEFSMSQMPAPPAYVPVSSVDSSNPCPLGCHGISLNTIFEIARSVIGSAYRPSLSSLKSRQPKTLATVMLGSNNRPFHSGGIKGQ